MRKSWKATLIPHESFTTDQVVSDQLSNFILISYRRLRMIKTNVLYTDHTHTHTVNTQTWSMSALRGRKYTMLSDISLARRKISNVETVKGEQQGFIIPQAHKETGADTRAPHQRISIRLHHGPDVKHLGRQVVWSSPGWWQEDHIPTKTGRQLQEVSLHEVDQISDTINCGVVPRQIEPLWADVHGHNWGFKDRRHTELWDVHRDPAEGVGEGSSGCF